jgi:peptidylprolyl isomerase
MHWGGCWELRTSIWGSIFRAQGHDGWLQHFDQCGRYYRVETLVKQKFYDGIVFHRVIPGFMAQTGDPTGTGAGGSSLPNLPAEFNATQFKRGILGMARSEDPDSANSQFFITTADAGFLDGKYTAFGEVVSGMDVVDKIKAGTQENNGAVTNPDKIVTMRMAPEAK